MWLFLPAWLLRAVHLEIAQLLEASACIQAFRRFTCRWTTLKFMFSGNGTNFKGAERELNDGIKAWNSQQFQNVIAQDDIEWTFIVPACSHSGGDWERIIRTIRKLMCLIMGEASLDDFDLATLVAEIERILNNCYRQVVCNNFITVPKTSLLKSPQP